LLSRTAQKIEKAARMRAANVTTATGKRILVENLQLEKAEE
jgi:hypothetical protein